MMKRFIKVKKISPLTRLTAEYIGMGVLVSLFSTFFGFYAAALLMADKCYPELGIDTIQTIHRQIFKNLDLALAGYSSLIFVFYWFFAKNQIKNILAIARQPAEENENA
jgi:hypothetical protein